MNIENNSNQNDTATAIAAAALMQAMDTYAICQVEGRTVTVWRATSQSVRAMGAKEFAESKNKVLDFISQLIGADVTTECAA